MFACALPLLLPRAVPCYALCLLSTLANGYLDQVLAVAVVVCQLLAGPPRLGTDHRCGESYIIGVLVGWGGREDSWRYPQVLLASAQIFWQQFAIVGAHRD